MTEVLYERVPAEAVPASTIRLQAQTLGKLRSTLEEQHEQWQGLISWSSDEADMADYMAALTGRGISAAALAQGNCAARENAEIASGQFAMISAELALHAQSALGTLAASRLLYSFYGDLPTPGAVPEALEEVLFSPEEADLVVYGTYMALVPQEGAASALFENGFVGDGENQNSQWFRDERTGLYVGASLAGEAAVSDPVSGEDFGQYVGLLPHVLTI